YVDRPLAQTLRRESRDHAAVPTLVDAGAIRVEVTDDRHLDSAVGVGESDVLVERFRGCVRPAMDGGRSEDPITVLAERDSIAAAVDLGGGCEQDPRAVPVRGGEHVFGAVDVRRDATEGVSDDVSDPDRGGQMKGQWVLRHESVDKVGVEHGPADDAERGMIAFLRKVSLGPGREVVKDGHRVPHLEQPVDQVRAHEPSASCDENPGRFAQTRGPATGSGTTATAARPKSRIVAIRRRSFGMSPPAGRRAMRPRRADRWRTGPDRRGIWRARLRDRRWS